MKNYVSETEREVQQDFLQQGYSIFKIEDLESLDRLKNKIFTLSKKVLGLTDVKMDDFFTNTDKFIEIPQLNDFRVKIIQGLVEDDEVRPSIYSMAKPYLDILVGNELAMQRTINLSIQMPNDSSSLLPVHTDVWSGNSPYEVVFWFPYVDCFKTKSMYILPLDKNTKLVENFEKFRDCSAEDLYQEIKEDVVTLDVPYGHGVIFTHSTLHGNVLNLEAETRWSSNFRFKGLLTPYHAKDIGEYFLPLNIKPVTQIGHRYRKPEIL